MTTQSKSAQNSEQSNTQAQTEQPIQKLKPNFEHRLSIFGDDATAHALNGAIDTLALQATNVLTLVSGNFLGEEAAPRSSDDVIFWSIESAINTIKDMQALVRAFHEAELAKNQA